MDDAGNPETGTITGMKTTDICCEAHNQFNLLILKSDLRKVLPAVSLWQRVWTVAIERSRLKYC